MASQRASGLLLHVSSLPSAYGIGDLGPAAFRFADFLARTNQRLWQMLPVNPVGPGASPYSSPSTFAGNPLLISPKLLVDADLLGEDDLAPLLELPEDRVDYARLVPRKRNVLRAAFRRFQAGTSTADTAQFRHFQEAQSAWLDEYALYAALKDTHDGAPWTEWRAPLAHRDPGALDHARETHAEAIEMHMFWQFLFHRQWSALQSYCHAHDIRLFGDLPIYVAHDSADVWAHQDLFRLDENGEASVVAGVPPDYFSPEGQLWGTPIYRWSRMEDRGFRWWTERLRHTFERFDLVRLDHFRGFEQYWQVPAHHDTATEGEWKDGPGAAFFETMRDELGDLPIIAEDLGIITEAVEALRDTFAFPGMAVLQFAFEGNPANEFLPHNYRRNLVAYTGTHDNNTTVGWWRGELSDEGRDFARSYLDLPDGGGGQEIHRHAVRAVMASVADRAVIPLQDIIGLGSEGRMNTPGTTKDNWAWRFTPDQISDEDEETLKTLTYLYGRASSYE
ncbi:MAG: 4-alpha-glucanotransferase [Salinibacter sp.]|uniref:4-alpha-glucanotransferase n=1 Tax=Salinibacter sp. TaxID=2065818 RepID=UPI0035D4A35C